MAGVAASLRKQELTPPMPLTYGADTSANRGVFRGYQYQAQHGDVAKPAGSRQVEPGVPPRGPGSFLHFRMKHPRLDASSGYAVPAWQPVGTFVKSPRAQPSVASRLPSAEPPRLGTASGARPNAGVANAGMPNAGMPNAGVANAGMPHVVMHHAGMASGAPIGYGTRGTSCRYTSWTGNGHSSIQDALDAAEEDYLYEEDELYLSATSLKKLAMMPSASESADNLANPFSWKELERSCRQLDAAKITISQIDLTRMEEEDDVLGQDVGGRPYHNPRDFAFAPAYDDQPMRSIRSTHSSLKSPTSTVSSASSFPSSATIGASSSVASPGSSMHGVFEARGPKDPLETGGLQGPPQAFLLSTGREPMTGPEVVRPRVRRFTNVMRTVKEKCGLLFTSSRRGSMWKQ